MKILIDINHPAHVHYFKNLIKIMEKEGHEFIITNRDQKIINDLLDAYSIKHIIRNKRPVKTNLFTSLKYIIHSILIIFKAIKITEIDIFLGFASFPCSLLSFIYSKPSIIIDDTEHNKVNHFFYKHLCSVILTPFYFAKNMGKKQIYFKAYVEQLYLNSKYFNTKVKSLFQTHLGSDPYLIIRFITFSASHDIGVKNRLTLEEKKEIIRNLSQNINVYVSLENETNDDFFKQFLITDKPENMHHLIANANLLITEGATMASEAGLLGVNYYYINPLKVGYINEQCSKYPHAHQCNGHQLLNNLRNLKYTKIRSNETLIKIENETINPTEYLVWFVKNYPLSKNLSIGKMIDKKFIEKFVN
jgi:hypothetical protein